MADLDVDQFAKSGSNSSNSDRPSVRTFGLVDADGNESIDVRLKEFADGFDMAGRDGLIAKAGRELDEQLPSGFSWKKAVDDMKAEVTPEVVDAIESAQREILKALVNAGKEHDVSFSSDIEKRVQ
jgi:endo-1,4-beta-mannosidase